MDYSAMTPHAHMGSYEVAYNLETGYLAFNRPTCHLTTLAPPEFRSSMLAQNTFEDMVLIIRTSRFIEHIILMLDTKILTFSR